MSKADIDEYVRVFHQISHEAYTNPEIVKKAPHNTAISRVDTTASSDPEKWAPTWRVYLRKHRR